MQTKNLKSCNERNTYIAPKCSTYEVVAEGVLCASIEQTKDGGFYDWEYVGE